MGGLQYGVDAIAFGYGGCPPIQHRHHPTPPPGMLGLWMVQFFYTSVYESWMRPTVVLYGVAI